MYQFGSQLGFGVAGEGAAGRVVATGGAAGEPVEGGRGLDDGGGGGVLFAGFAESESTFTTGTEAAGATAVGALVLGVGDGAIEATGIAALVEEAATGAGWLPRTIMNPPTARPA